MRRGLLPVVARGQESDFCMAGSRLFRRDCRMPMVPWQVRSCARRLGRWVAQAVDPVEDAREHRTRERRLGQLADGVTGVAHEPGLAQEPGSGLVLCSMARWLQSIAFASRGPSKRYRPVLPPE